MLKHCVHRRVTGKVEETDSIPLNNTDMTKPKRNKLNHTYLSRKTVGSKAALKCNVIENQTYIQLF
jgi:hypothetical protein